MFNHFLLHIFIHAYRSSHAKVLRKKDVLKNYFLLRSALNNLSGHYDPSFLSSRPLHTYHPINSFSHGSGTILRKIHINTYLMTDHIAGTDHLLKASLYNSFIIPYIIFPFANELNKQNLMQEGKHSYGITVTKLNYSEIFL